MAGHPDPCSRSRLLDRVSLIGNFQGQVQKEASMQETSQKVVMPALPLTGGCQCGAVRYRITGAPIVFYFCHCTQCQRQSSSAFAESLRIRASDLETEGELAEVRWTVSSGAVRRGRFCPSCGVR